MKNDFIANDPFILEMEKSKRRCKYIIIALLALLGAVLLCFALATIYINSQEEGVHFKSTLVSTEFEEDNEELYKVASEKLIRMHIVANSNSEADQALKLCVRDRVLEYLNSVYPDKIISLDEAGEILDENMENIRQVAACEIQNQGFTYEVSADRGVRHFPGKVYGDFFLPAGDYNALCLEIGEAKGKNWWCIAFPALCLYGNYKTDDEGALPLLNVTIGERVSQKMQTKRGKVSFRCRWLRFLNI